MSSFKIRSLIKNLFKLFELSSIILLVFSLAKDSRQALEDMVLFAFKQIRKKCASFSRRRPGTKTAQNFTPEILKMEELTDFLIDVFENVWRKFKINPFIVIAGGIVFSFLFMPYIFKNLPLFSAGYAVLSLSALAASFFFIKIFVLTIKEVKINFNTAGSVFKGLGIPFVFTVILGVIFGGLSFAVLTPFIFPALTERFMPAVFGFSVLAAIALLAFLPIAVTALLFSYEANSAKEAFKAAAKLLSRGKGRIFFLMSFLVLCSLVLKLTYIGMIFVFPLVIMAMDQARESLVRLDEERAYAENAKRNKAYRHKNFHAKDYSDNGYENGESRRYNFFGAENARSRQESAESSGSFNGLAANKEPDGKEDILQESAGSGSVEILDEKSMISQKIVSAAEHHAPPPAEETEENLSLSDILDFGLYEKSGDSVSDKAAGGDGTGAQKDEKEAVDIDIDIEYEKYPKENDVKREYKSGKEYINGFGNIRRRAPVVTDPEQMRKRAKEAKSYIENFGIIKRKK